MDFTIMILKTKFWNPENVILNQKRKDNGLNDGRCDPEGRFWVGSMNDLRRIQGKYEGNLYCYHPDGQCVSQNLPVGVANGLGGFARMSVICFFLIQCARQCGGLIMKGPREKTGIRKGFLNLKNLSGKPRVVHVWMQMDVIGGVISTAGKWHVTLLKVNLTGKFSSHSPSQVCALWRFKTGYTFHYVDFHQA
ncbi:MAG: hypothetical protein Ct9H300mP28_08090 [Pseudomonadota bacterium]|nr:MAG: hypothetical protein Ct9H300mP28_08090 [Pseudomonadota bacterium]